MDSVPNASTSSQGEEDDAVIEGSCGGPYMVEKIVGIYMGKVAIKTGIRVGRQLDNCIRGLSFLYRGRHRGLFLISL